MEARLKSCFILPAVLLALLAAGCQERELPVAPEAPAFSTGEDPPIELWTAPGSSETWLLEWRQ